MTALEIKPATSRLVAQCLNQLRHLLFYPDEDRSFWNVAKFLPDCTASHPPGWHSHRAHPRDNLNSRAPNNRISYFPDLTSDPDDQTPTVRRLAPADTQYCWARIFSGLNPDQDIIHIHVVSCVVPYLGYAILNDLLHERWTRTACEPTFETSERKWFICSADVPRRCWYPDQPATVWLTLMCGRSQLVTGNVLTGTTSCWSSHSVRITRGDNCLDTAGM